jgi:hypothetical protein
MPSQLVVVAGPDKGRAFPLDAGAALSIGRGATSLTRLLDLAVSRGHCEVRVDAVVVVKLLSKRPDGRRPSAGAMLADLQRLANV